MANSTKSINGTNVNKTNNEAEKDLELDILKELSSNNAYYFNEDTTENGQRLYISLMSMKESMDSIEPKYKKIQERASKFDFDENTPGNGYRSFLRVVDCAISYGIKLNRKVSEKRSSALFRKTSITKDVEACAHLISSLDTCLTHVQVILSWCDDGNLFPNEEHSPQELLFKCDDINQYCFYGRCLGFQFCDSFKSILQFISFSMAMFSEGYYSGGSFFSKWTNNVVTSMKYIADPEQRARRIVNISQNADVDFCKAFWSLSESDFMLRIPLPTVAVSKVIKISPEPLLVNVNGKEIEILPPSSHIGRKPVQVRLICYESRQGMIGESKNKNKSKQLARGLLIHCHGGGFVSQSSRSHEGYLRDWSRILNVPILSVDYSLAPEAPYPRALEEVVYAYCWALNNLNLLGTTGERIIMAGDSAGANLVLTCTLKCLHLGIPIPHGIFVTYVPTVVNFIPTPARLLCMMDPLLPFGFLMRCIKAYACPNPLLIQQEQQNDNDSNNKNNKENHQSDTESFEEITESDLMELQAHKSPVSETSDTLTYASLSSNAVEIIDEKEIKINLNNTDIEQSEKYVSDFLEKYVLDSDTDTDGTRVPILKQESLPSSSDTYDYSLKNRLTSFVTNLRGRIGGFVNNKSYTKAEQILDVERECNLYEEVHFDIPEDPYLSPYFATDEDLKRLPPVRVLTLHMDPCLDDCVMFAKRLKDLGNDVSLTILDGLPHGFLNFFGVSQDAYDASVLCTTRIKELLNLESLSEQQ